MLSDRTKRCQEALCLLRRLEPPHGPLSLACGLVGVLGPIVEDLMLVVVDLQLQLCYGGTVALEFVAHYVMRGAYCIPLSNRPKNLFAACLLRRLCRRMSSTTPS